MEVLSIIKGLIFYPRKNLEQIKKGVVSKKLIYTIFAFSMIVTFIRSFFVRWHQSFTFFDKQFLNVAVIFLNNPFLMWLREYLLYFIGVFVLVKLCNLFSKSKCESMPYMLMAISSIGILGQVLFWPLHYLLTHDLLKILGLIFYLWNLTLIFLAVKIVSSLSYVKTSIVILIPLIVLGFSPFGIWSFMSPYFLFMY